MPSRWSASLVLCVDWRNVMYRVLGLLRLSTEEQAAKKMVVLDCCANAKNFG